MNEKLIHRIISDLMFTIINHPFSTKDDWKEVYAAVCAVKQLIERNPIVHLNNISPEDGVEAETLGTKLGLCIADEADKITGNFRN